MLPKVDLVLTDPPYGIDLKNHAPGTFRRSQTYFIAGDKDCDAGGAVVGWCCLQKLPTCVFASPELPWPGNWRNLLVWDKGGAVGGGGDTATCWKRTWELIQIARNATLNGDRDPSVIRFPITPADSKLHPAQKPLELLVYLVNKLSAVGQTILDPFMGSGTTLRASKDLGRKAIGIEISEEYCEIAAKRLRQEVFSFSAEEGKILRKHEPADMFTQP